MKVPVAMFPVLICKHLLLIFINTADTSLPNQKVYNFSVAFNIISKSLKAKNTHVTSYNAQNKFQSLRNEKDKENAVFWREPEDRPTISDHNTRPKDIASRSKRQTTIMIHNTTDQCEELFRCNYNKDKELPNCYCDRQCGQFNDCCNDFNETSPSLNLVDTELEDSMTCRVSVMADEMRYFRGYMMVVKCPVDYENKTISLLCNSTIDKHVPVTDEQGIVYSNPYCAECNGVASYQPWIVRAVADTCVCKRHVAFATILDSNVTTLSKFNSLYHLLCTIAYDPPKNTTPRVCLTSSQKVRRKLCFGNDIDDNDRYLYRSWGGPFPLNIVFSLRTPNYSRSHRCGSGHVFDQQLGLCFSRDCGEDGTMACNEDDGIFVQNYRIELNLDLISKNRLYVAETESALSAFIVCLPTETYGLKVESSTISNAILLVSRYPLFKIKENEIYSHIKTNIVLVVTKKRILRDILNLESYIQGMAWSYTVQMEGNYSKEVWRIWNITEYLREIDYFIGNYIILMHYNQSIIDRFKNSSLMERYNRNTQDGRENCDVTSSVFFNGKNARQNKVRLDCSIRNENKVELRNRLSSVNLNNPSTKNQGYTVQAKFVQRILMHTLLAVSTVGVVILLSS